MPWHVLLARLRGRIAGRGDEARLEEEIASHLDLLAAEFERSGMTLEEARLKARREFGGVAQMREAHRDERRLPFFDALAQDLSYAFRQLRRSPGFASAAIVTLALGLGANTAIYRVMDAVLLRTLPVADPEKLVLVQLLANDKPHRFSYPLFREMAARQQVLDGMFATSQLPLRQAVLRGRGPQRPVHGAVVTGAYFHVLGIQAHRGRLFTDEDDRASAPPLAVISYDFWTREFDRSLDALGQTIQLNSVVAGIIGVAPPGFYGEVMGDEPDVWLPMSVQPQVMPSDWLNAPSSSWLAVMGRLRNGISARQAQTALDALYRQLADLNVRTDGSTYRVKLEPGSRGLAELAERFGGPLWVLMAIVGMVLLMACCNLANLLLGRATARTHEIGVRLAVGASRSRLVRHLLTESFVLSALGALAGLALARWGSRELVALASQDGDRWHLSLDTGWRVLGFTAALTALATCLFGLAPALAATRVDLHSALQSNRRSGATGRSRSLFATGAIVAQLALSLLLVSGASALVRSLWNLRNQDFGFDAERVLIVDLPLEFNKTVMARARALRQPLFDRLNQLPGVRSAAVSGFGPCSAKPAPVRSSVERTPLAGSSAAAEISTSRWSESRAMSGFRDREIPTVLSSTFR